MNNIYAPSSLPLGGQSNLEQSQECDLEASGAQPARIRCMPGRVHTAQSSTLQILPETDEFQKS